MSEPSDSTQKPAEATKARSELTPCIEKAFGDSKYSDLSIICGDRVWKVHRIIICSQAPFFDKACSSGFKEEKLGEINLEEDDPEAVNEMLRYLYTADYLDEAEAGPEDPAHCALVMNVLLHTIADKYDIPALCDLATKKFAARAGREWNTGAFASAIEEMYMSDSGKKEMRKIAVAIAAEHAEELFYADYGAKYRKMLETVPKFAAELAVKCFDKKEHRTESRYHCPHPECGREVCMETLKSGSNVTRACPYCRHGYEQDKWMAKAI